MAKPTDPFWWLLFAAGGTLAAFLTPVLILLTGFAAPVTGATGPFAYDRMLAMAADPLIGLVLFGFISLSFFHWAHRFRYTLEEGLALKRAWVPVAVACYGAAIAGTILAAVSLIRL